MKSAVILMSGGLDSLVAAGFSQKEYDIKLALTFNYGQKSASKEISASEKICEYYNIEHKVIDLDWLKEISKTSLVTEVDIPTANLGTKESAQAVWIPNRNGLFLNIAASFADACGYDYILFGANKDEGLTFPDNTEEFRHQISKVFETSTLVKPKVIAPLINYTKGDIVRIAVEESMPLNLLWSCYKSGDKHCGICESCQHLKRALIANHKEDYIDILFSNDENTVN